MKLFFTTLLSVIIISLYGGCDNGEFVDVAKKKKIEDSVSSVKQRLTHDSIYKKYKNGISVKSNFDFDNLTVKVLSKLSFSNEIHYQLGDDDIYGYKTAKRNEVYASIKLKLNAKKTPSELSVSDLDYDRLYLPRLSLYEVVETDSIQKIKWLKDLDNYNMVYRMPKHIPYMEAYFDYEESGTFLFYELFGKDVAKAKLLLTVRSAKSYGVDPMHTYINLDNIIWKN